MKKKVLILAYDFPPYVSVGGLRPYSWYKYFHEFDLYPVIVTRQWGNKYGNHLDYIAPSESDKTIIEESETGTIIRTPYKPNLSNRLLLKYGEKRFRLLRKAITAWYEFTQYVFTIGPKSGLLRGADEYLNDNKVDVIIATGDPFVLFSYANKLSKRYSIPWIADYRDIWSNDLPMNSKPIFKTWSKYFESKLIRQANRISMVSEFVRFKSSKQLESKEVLIIENGFDDEIITDEVISLPQNQKVLTIAYAGSIFKWHPLDRFFDAVNEFKSKYPSFEFVIKFYGTNINKEIEHKIEHHYSNIKQNVEVIPRMPYEHVVKRLAQAHILLLFNYYSFMGTKIYDYLGIKRHILMCFSNDPVANELKEKCYTITNDSSLSQSLQADLIEKTLSGKVAKDKNHLIELLNQYRMDFIEKNQINFEGINTHQFSRKNQLEKLVNLLNKAINEFDVIQNENSNS